MKLLDTVISNDGRTLRQLKRTARVALYELTNEHGLVYGYEVVKIRVQKQRECFGRIFAERELYPCDSDFGRLAWSFGRNHKSQAFEKYDLLVQAERQSSDAVAVPAVLATEFRHAGRTFTQVKRSGRVALYQLSGAGYEVVVIQQQKAKMIKGYWYPDRELMPDVSQWGRYGWSYLASDLAGAEKKYRNLLPTWGAGAQFCAPSLLAEVMA